MAVDQKPNDGFFAFAAETAKAVRDSLKEPLEQVTGPLLRDGVLAASFRQGVDEIGMALKAFPDAIQAHEYGTVFDPLPSEVAAARKPDLPSPSEIAAAHGVHGQDRGQDRGGLAAGGDKKPDLPSPSEIANRKQPPGQEEDYWRKKIDQDRKSGNDGTASNDQNERGQGRSLPDEQRDQDRGRGR